MVDPVRTGPVTPMAANVAGSAELRPRLAERVTSSASQKAGEPVKPNLPQLLELVADLASSGPPVDIAKIAQVRRAIAEGSYKIDVDALAKAIVSFGPKD